MDLTKCRRSIVLRQLYLFLTYLDQTCDYWFTAIRPTTPAPSTLTNPPLTPNTPHSKPRICVKRYDPATRRRSLIGASTSSAVALERSRRISIKWEPKPSNKRRRLSESQSVETEDMSTAMASIVGELRPYTHVQLFSQMRPSLIPSRRTRPTLLGLRNQACLLPERNRMYQTKFESVNCLSVTTTSQ